MLCKLPSFLFCYATDLQEPQIFKGHLCHSLSTLRLAITAIMTMKCAFWHTENPECLANNTKSPKNISSCRHQVFWSTLAIPMPKSSSKTLLAVIICSFINYPCFTNWNTLSFTLYFADQDSSKKIYRILRLNFMSLIHLFFLCADSILTGVT